MKSKPADGATTNTRMMVVPVTQTLFKDDKAFHFDGEVLVMFTSDGHGETMSICLNKVDTQLSFPFEPIRVLIEETRALRTSQVSST